MTREIIEYTTEADWLANRRQDLTSTESAALFGASPYVTEYELHHIKRGIMEPDFELNDRIRWGNRLEAAIALGVAEDHGLLVEPFKNYIRIPGERIGASFDFRVVGLVDHAVDNVYREWFRARGPGLLEVKNVDFLAHRRGWVPTSAEGEGEAPPHIEFQVQHQLEVADHPWAMIAALVGGNTPHVLLRERDTFVGEQIRALAADFWAGVDSGTPPAPDYAADAETIGKLYRHTDGSSIDLSDNDRLHHLCAQLTIASKDEKEAASIKKAAKSEILTIIKLAKTAQADGFCVSAGTTKESTFQVNKESSERLYVTVKEYGLTVAPVTGSNYKVEREAFRNMRITPTV